MRELLAEAGRLAATECPIALLGEPGSGRRRLAKLVHLRSGRAEGPLATLRCDGTWKAVRDRCRDAAKAAEGGTLIIDAEAAEFEIADSLRVELSWRSPSLVSGKPRGVRLILREHQVDGLARRVTTDAAWLAVPPLRQRREDLPDLVREFIADAAFDVDADDEFDVESEVFDALEAYSWPGNFVEFEAVIHRAAVVAARRSMIRLTDLPREVRAALRETGADTTLTLAEVERRHILAVLESVDGRRGAAARALGISRATLLRRLRNMGMVRRRPRSGS